MKSKIVCCVRGVLARCDKADRILLQALVVLIVVAPNWSPRFAQANPASIDVGQILFDSSCIIGLSQSELWCENGYLDKAYDSVRPYIKHCPDDSEAFSALRNVIGICIAQAPELKSESAMIDLRHWLMSIRNHSQIPDWYCECLRLIGLSFQRDYPDGSAGLAMTKFLLASPHCTQNDSAYGAQYDAFRKEQILIWKLGAPNDSIQYFDSTLPSFHELGLDSLLGDNSGVLPQVPIPVDILSAAIEVNPFADDTKLRLTMAQNAYLKIEVFDALGRVIRGQGAGKDYAPGVYEVPLGSPQWAAGIYYVRLSTENNEVRTMKLVKE